MEGFPKNTPQKIERQENSIEKPQIKEGIDFVFEQNTELSQIGNQELYSKYLDTIFPESKVKDIIYHGGTFDENDRGKDPFTGEFGGKYGFYLTGSKSRANKYIKSNYNEDYVSRSKLYSTIVNIKNPLDRKIWGKWKFGLDSIGEKEMQIIKDNNADGLIEKDFLSRFTQYNTQYVVFDINQIHILGSSSDIEKFKSFMRIKNTDSDPHPSV